MAVALFSSVLKGKEWKRGWVERDNQARMVWIVLRKGGSSFLGIGWREGMQCVMVAVIMACEIIRGLPLYPGCLA
jgi:hypothetical protein